MTPGYYNFSSRHGTSQHATHDRLLQRQVERYRRIARRDLHAPVASFSTRPRVQLGPSRDQPSLVKAQRRIESRRATVAWRTYRPFSTQHVYFDRQSSTTWIYQLPSMFPTPRTRTSAFYVVGTGSRLTFRVLMADCSAGPARLGWTQWPVLPPLDLRAGRRRRGARPCGEAELSQHGYRRDRQHHRRDPRRYEAASATRQQGRHLLLRLRPAPRPGLPRDLRRRPAEDAAPHPAVTREDSSRSPRPAASWPTCTSATSGRAVPARRSTSSRRLDAADRGRSWRVAKMKSEVQEPTGPTIVYNRRSPSPASPTRPTATSSAPARALEWIIDRYQVQGRQGLGHRQRPQRLVRRARRPALHRRPASSGS